MKDEIRLFELQARAISELNVNSDEVIGECFCCGSHLTHKTQSARRKDSCVECYVSSAREQQARIARRTLEQLGEQNV